MKYERWLIPETDDAAVEALMDAGYPYLVSTVLASRGVVTPEQAAAAIEAGAFAVIVGTAITHPTSITTWFKAAVEG